MMIQEQESVMLHWYSPLGGISDVPGSIFAH